MMARTLDTDLRQVLVYFAGDPVPYHHRLLVVQGPAGKWVGLTPDHEVLVVDLAEQVRVGMPETR